MCIPFDKTHLVDKENVPYNKMAAASDDKSEAAAATRRQYGWNLECYDP